MFKIGEFSLLNKVTVATLRHYEKIGLLVPEYVDQWTGYRYYSASQLPKINRIIALKKIGFSLAEIAQILSDGTSVQKMTHQLKLKQDEITAEVEIRQQQISQIEKYLKTLQKEEDCVVYNITVKDFPEMIVSSMRGVVAGYNDQARMWCEMGEYMKSEKVTCPNTPGHCFTIYHDGEYKENMDIEICEEVTAYATDSETVKFKKMAVLKDVACVIHKGSPDTLHLAYGALLKWIEDNGYEINGNLRDACYVGPWDEPNPENWIIEIMLPVKRK
ncbi:MAG: MerR family transcriptional regulator [Clostridia bacterium]|nr:MerR family transcriptional regulator [Clostridia bacterium]